MSAFLIDDSDDIEASVRGDGDDVPDGLERGSKPSVDVCKYRREDT